jgi:hypothetical protein
MPEETTGSASSEPEGTLSSTSVAQQAILRAAPAHDGQPTLDRTARVLLGWLEPQEAALTLQGRRADVTLTTEQRELIESTMKAVQSRTDGADQSDLVRPIDQALHDYIDALRASPLAGPYFAEGWEVALVDLPRVCGFQPNVFVDHATQRVSDVDPAEARSIASVTLPLGTSGELTHQFDQQRQAFIISSANPNVRVIGAVGGPVPGGLPGTVMLGFQISMMASYVQVAAIHGRYFLRDGYHRALGLIARGVRYAPVFIRHDIAYDQLVTAPAGMLRYEAYMGDRPPFLRDYLDDTVSCEARLPAAHKIVLVQASEFGVLG